MTIWQEYIGKTIGNWKVLERDYYPTSKQHSTFLWCECLLCHQKYSVSLQSLKDGKSFCCRKCYLKEAKTLKYKVPKGKRFGLLTVIGEPNYEKNKTHAYVKCKCDCGKIIDVRVEHLLGYNKGHGRTGYTISCGCNNVSNGELKIQRILDNLKIKYVQEKSFTNCINLKTNTKLRFDFYLPDYNCCIEYDGEQHFQEVEFFKYSLKNVQERDQIKNQYCESNNIKLIRIPYWDYDKINGEYVLTRILN